ncbi:hypothetical protein ACFRQM_34280 [Streptomyces sp. NPDC056831]|uniref:hypothetical protein n=1 Tax=Streptomyces sp. NPDC056831 TaxID=3345954 RepID=UPI00367A8664
MSRCRYRIVLAEGMHDALVQYRNQDLLINMWPALRTLISCDIRDAWESIVPEPTHSTATAT